MHTYTQLRKSLHWLVATVADDDKSSFLFVSYTVWYPFEAYTTTTVGLILFGECHIGKFLAFAVIKNAQKACLLHQLIRDGRVGFWPRGWDNDSVGGGGD